MDPGQTIEIEVLRHLAKEGCFTIRVKGNSMEPRIRDGDIILVDRNRFPASGNIVVAVFNGESMVKRLYRRKGVVKLRSDNPEHDDIEVGPEDDLRIGGEVVKIVDSDV